MTGTLMEGLIGFISFYCIIFLFGFLIVKLLKISNNSKYFTIIVSWVLWLIFAIYVRENILDYTLCEASELDNALFYLYFATAINPVHHLAMLFSLYKVLKGNITK
jgi:hypothetical protein